MEKKTLRKLSLYLALTRLLSLGTMAVGEEIGYTFENGKPSDAIVQRELVSESGKYAVFEGNSVLYGGNSTDFLERSNKEILNPRMWKLLQTRFPLKEFASFDQAMDFYRIYLEIVNNAKIKYLHKMYLNGNLNKETFIVDLFSPENYRITSRYLAKTFAEIELERYSHSKEFQEAFSHGYNPSSEELKALFKLYQEKMKKYQALYDMWDSLEDDFDSLVTDITPTNILKKP